MRSTTFEFTGLRGFSRRSGGMIGSASTAPEKETNMRFQHDCDKCKPLGEHGDADLYFCDQGAAGPTVIARYSSDGADYASGICAAPFVPDLGEAKKRAIALGLLTPNNLTAGWKAGRDAATP